MPISVTAPPTCCSWTNNQTPPLASASSSSSSKLSGLSSLQFHPRFPRANPRFTAFPSKPRTLHLMVAIHDMGGVFHQLDVNYPTFEHFSGSKVQAKKQTFSSLDELLEKAEKPVLVDFYATWCGPCQLMGPILDEVSISMGGTIQVVKIDTEKYPQIADKYNIEALPTFIIFKDGKPYDRFEGALRADQMIQRIQNTLKVNK